MVIKNIIDLVEYFDTSAFNLEKILSDKARRKISVLPFPSRISLCADINECNAAFNVTCRYPFESSAVDTFLATVDRICTDAYDKAFDDPIEMLMNMTNPGGELQTAEDAGHIMSEAEAQGWHLNPSLTPEDILAMYNDLEAEEEE